LECGPQAGACCILYRGIPTDSLGNSPIPYRIEEKELETRSTSQADAGAASICTGKNLNEVNYKYKDELRAFRVHRPLDGVLNKFSRISQRQLLFDVSLVRLDRLRADVQFVGYLPRAMPGAN
jgi:hypothetical protein